MNTLKAISIINWIFLFAAYLMYAQRDIMLGIVVIISALVTIGSIILIDDNIEVK